MIWPAQLPPVRPFMELLGICRHRPVISTQSVVFLVVRDGKRRPWSGSILMAIPSFPWWKTMFRHWASSWALLKIKGRFYAGFLLSTLNWISLIIPSNRRMIRQILGACQCVPLWRSWCASYTDGWSNWGRRRRHDPTTRGVTGQRKVLAQALFLTTYS